MCTCMQICRDIYFMSYLHAVLTFRLWAVYADIFSSGIEKQVQSNVYKLLAKRCEPGSSGVESAGTHRVTLCAQRSQMKSYSFQQTHHNKQTRAQSLRHSQILLHLCSALQSPTSIYQGFPFVLHTELPQNTEL